MARSARPRAEVVMALASTLALATGCRIGFDTVDRTGDAGTDAGVGDGATSDMMSSDAPIDGPAFTCKPSYTFVVGASRYRLNGTDNWPSSETDCESDGTGSHLVVIDTVAERDALLALAGATSTWIGASDRVTEGVFLRVTGGGLAAVPPWAAGSPIANGPDCVSWDPIAGTIVDTLCDASRNRICECDGVAADLSTY